MSPWSVFFFFSSAHSPLFYIFTAGSLKKKKKLSLASFQLPAQGILLTSCLRARRLNHRVGLHIFKYLECMDLSGVFRNSLQSEQPQLLGLE